MSDKCQKNIEYFKKASNKYSLIEIADSDNEKKLL